MLMDILREEYDKIDRGAVREKQEVGYTVDLVQKNYDQIVDTTGTDDDRKLYDFVKEAFRQVRRADFPPGTLIVHADSEEFKESTSLGWIEKGERAGEHLFWRSDKYSYWLTDLGKKVVEDYRRFKQSISGN